MLQTPHTPEKDAAFVSRIRRYDSTSGPRRKSRRRAEAPRGSGALGLTPSPPRSRNPSPPTMQRQSPSLIWAVVAVGLLVRRHACSLHPYSGEHDPPRYGDYEAHRHWMEITYHLPSGRGTRATRRLGSGLPAADGLH